jgi:hypothetical protein
MAMGVWRFVIHKMGYHRAGQESKAYSPWPRTTFALFVHSMVVWDEHWHQTSTAALETKY